MTKRVIIQITFIFLLAVTGMGIWLLEITYRFGWPSLKWLYEGHFSIYLITGFAVTAYLLPLSSRIKQSGWYLLYPGMVLYLISVIGFHLAKTILFILYARFNLIPWPQLLIGMFIVLGLTALCFHLVTNRWIAKLKKIQILLLGIAIIGTVPLSLLAVSYYNGPAPASYTNFVDAVKTGHPFFWIVINMGIAGLYSNRYLVVANPSIEEITRDDILDDQAFG